MVADHRGQTEPGIYWLIWDGHCGFCRRSVDWVRSHDRDGLFRTVPYQEAPSPPMTDELRERAPRAGAVLTPSRRAVNV